ncbi:Biopolymer transport protein ExbD/TolR [Hymenobacter daecheongensis DSM 21074]|uniref:Biopolymer transport protein ExbD/TolR n=2 Tax=Hymenobacter daecheongensis TaxID=496053 RepID=A0A1M6LRN5_9BACT|nr:Biopolymer transport protein ExbD/TolR [Hymenobacter daecheongensis DSM 21074]
MLPSPHIPRPTWFRSRRFSSPQGMDIMASVVLLLVMFYMMATKPKLMGEEPGPYLKLPQVFTTPGRLPENHSIIISMDAQGRAYLATSDSVVQTAMILEVARGHQVRFTAAQRQQLGQLAYLNLSIEQLPTWLSASTAQRQQMTAGISATSGNDQLTEYVLAGQAANRAEFGKPAYIMLRVDQDAPMKSVMELLGLLQRQGINRYNLLAERKEWPRDNTALL